MRLTSRDIYGNTPIHLAAANFHLDSLWTMLFYYKWLDVANELFVKNNNKGDCALSIIT